VLPFTLRQLEYIVAVADHGHFGRAAAACGVSQPSLSTQLAQVEEAIGLQLFERGRSGAKATRRGEPFIAAARALLGRASDLVSLARASDPFSGELRLGAIPTIAPFALPALSEAVKRAYPSLRIVWTEDQTPDLVALTDAGLLDGALLAVEAELGGLDVLPIGDDPFVLAVQREHPLARGRSIPGPEALADLPLLVLDDGHCLRDQTLAACGRAAPDSAAARYRATSLTTLIELVAAGLGVTLLPSLALAPDGSHPRLATVPFSERIPGRTLGFATRPGSPVLGVLRALIPIARAALGIERASGDGRPGPG
jgi:LysR family hydrogen peroxide-inducible transcriptional activator